MICSKCRKETEERSFATFRQRDGSVGRRGECKLCRSARQQVNFEQKQAWRKAYNERTRGIRGQKNKERRERAAEVVDRYKAKPCMDCGVEWPPVAMDFDHVRGLKVATISSMVAQAYKLPLILEEMEKCDVVCACCHRIRIEKKTWLRLETRPRCFMSEETNKMRETESERKNRREGEMESAQAHLRRHRDNDTAFYASVLETLKDAKTAPSFMFEKSWMQSEDRLGKHMLLITPIAFGQNYWSYLLVEILDRNSETTARLGHYVRNYSSLYDTFHAFRTADGREYALYSKSYTSTRIMSLPDCKDIGGEDAADSGFCPTGYYVPQPMDAVEREWNDEPNKAFDGTFGFICGCHWGDDSSWKIQYLDLTDLTKPKRDDRFGYIELPDGMELADAINLSYYREEGMGDDYRPVKITVERQFNISTVKEERRAEARAALKESVKEADKSTPQETTPQEKLSGRFQALRNIFAWLN